MLSQSEISMKALEEKLRTNPNSLIFSRLADSYRKVGDLQQAVSICTKGLKHHPDYVTGRIILGRCYLEQENYDNAIREFTKICQIDRRNQIAIKMLADIFSKQGMKEKAGDLYKLVLKMDPDNPSLIHFAGTLEGNNKNNLFEILGIEDIGKETASAVELEKTSTDIKSLLNEAKTLVSDGTEKQTKIVSDIIPDKSGKPSKVINKEEPDVDEILSSDIQEQDIDSILEDSLEKRDIPSEEASGTIEKSDIHPPDVQKETKLQEKPNHIQSDSEDVVDDINTRMENMFGDEITAEDESSIVKDKEFSYLTVTDKESADLSEVFSGTTETTESDLSSRLDDMFGDEEVSEELVSDISDLDETLHDEDLISAVKEDIEEEKSRFTDESKTLTASGAEIRDKDTVEEEELKDMHDMVSVGEAEEMVETIPHGPIDTDVTEKYDKKKLKPEIEDSSAEEKVESDTVVKTPTGAKDTAITQILDKEIIKASKEAFAAGADEHGEPEDYKEKGILDEYETPDIASTATLEIHRESKEDSYIPQETDATAVYDLEAIQKIASTIEDETFEQVEKATPVRTDEISNKTSVTGDEVISRLDEMFPDGKKGLEDSMETVEEGEKTVTFSSVDNLETDNVGTSVSGKDIESRIDEIFSKKSTLDNEILYSIPDEGSEDEEPVSEFYTESGDSVLSGTKEIRQEDIDAAIIDRDDIAHEFIPEDEMEVVGEKPARDDVSDESAFIESDKKNEQLEEFYNPPEDVFLSGSEDVDVKEKDELSSKEEVTESFSDEVMDTVAGRMDLPEMESEFAPENEMDNEATGEFYSEAGEAVFDDNEGEQVFTDETAESAYIEEEKGGDEEDTKDVIKAKELTPDELLQELSTKDISASMDKMFPNDQVMDEPSIDTIPDEEAEEVSIAGDGFYNVSGENAITSKPEDSISPAFEKEVVIGEPDFEEGDESKSRPVQQKQEEIVEADAIPDHVLTPTLADIYYQQDQPYLAIQIYRRLLERDPENEKIANRVKEIERKIMGDEALIKKSSSSKKPGKKKKAREKTSSSQKKRNQKDNRPLKGIRIKKKIKNRIKEVKKKKKK